MCVERAETSQKEKADFGHLSEYLQDCVGMIVVGAVLFAVLAGLANGCSANAEHLKAELLAHQQVFLGINQQAAGLAILFCGIFFMTAGSENAKVFAERVAIPFVSFLRDGAAIATGAFFAQAVKILYENYNSSERLVVAIVPELEASAGWFVFVMAGTVLIFTLELAKNNKKVKLNYGSITSGAACSVIGLIFIFGK